MSRRGLLPGFIEFTDMMPSRIHADADGYIDAQEFGTGFRPALWDWVNTAELWNANDFIAWRPRRVAPALLTKPIRRRKRRDEGQASKEGT